MIEIQNQLGNAVTPKELAIVLGIDSRTVVKYASRWGGVEVAPGVWRFFEKRIKEVLDNGQSAYEEGRETMERPCNGLRKNSKQMVPRQLKRIRKESGCMGTGNAKSDDEREAPKRSHGIFS